MSVAPSYNDCHCCFASKSSTTFLHFVDRRRRASSLFASRRRRSFDTALLYPAGQARLLKYRRCLKVEAIGDDNVDLSSREGNEMQNSNGNRKFERNSWSELLKSYRHACVAGSHRYLDTFQEELMREAGPEIEAVERVYLVCLAFVRSRWQELKPLLQASKNMAEELSLQARHSVDVLKRRSWPQFVSWNRFELWKDVRRWDAQRYIAIFVYLLMAASCIRALDIILLRPQRIKQLTNSFMEAVIPDPSYHNVKKLRKVLWRKRMPKGLKMQRYVYDENGALLHDLSYVGENPWDETERDIISLKVDDFIDKHPNLTEEQKTELKDKAAEITELEERSKEARAKMSWEERIEEWDKLLKLEDLEDNLLAKNSDFVIKVDMDEVKKTLEERKKNRKDKRPSFADIVTTTWWRYRPKLPYVYLISKLRRLEVESAVYTADLKRLYVKMKEGFPSEYTVDLPVDPILHQLLKSCEVEIDLIGGSEWSYYLRTFLVLAPSVLILLQIKYLSNQLMEMTSEKIIDLLKMDREHLILPEDSTEKATSEYKDVVVGEDIWKVLEEIMGYMKDPMRYYSKGLFLPRGILISGPPGTGKTLLARAIARDSGVPFVFASGAEFVESSSGNGAEKLFDIFFTARANAPSFIFIDEIDALASKSVEEDPERRATFDQLITELDGLPEDTSVDRFSKRQAIILICATNRPEDLHSEFLRPGRIDREIYMGLPGEEQRLSIFKVHSRSKRLAADVEFSKLVFRTAGYSGADIRNMINEAGILAARRDRSEICQQDFVDVLDKQLYEGMGMSLTDEELIQAQEEVSLETRHLIAVHEAGHVLLAHLFPRYDNHALTHLLPGGRGAAFTLFYPREEMLSKSYTTVGYLKMHLVVAHGGRCAERLVFGSDITDGGQDDLERISRIAREIAISHSSPRLGLYPMLWKDKFDPPLPLDKAELIPSDWDAPGNRIANMTMELSELFTREVTRYADEAEDEAMRALSMNRHILDRLATQLFERINMSGLEIADIIKSMNPIMLPDYMDPRSYKMDPKAMDEARKGIRYEELDIWQAPLPSC